MAQNDFVTYETAKALKDAGYPQPELKDGQLWYATLHAGTHEEYSDIYIVAFDELHHIATAAKLEYINPVYCPNLADLLDTLGPGATVRALGLGEFEVTDDPNRKPIVTNNPCEALGRLILENTKQLFRPVETT